MLKLEDLYEISYAIQEKLINPKDFFIGIEVKDQETLNKVNEDIFYKLYKEDKENHIVDEPSEINVNIGGLMFRYTIKKKEDDNS